MFSAIDDHAVDRRLDSKGPGRQEQQAQAESSNSRSSPRRSRSGKLEGASLKAEAKASWTDGLRVQGVSQAQEVRNRKASPEESGEERRRKPKFQERFGRHRKDGSSQGHHPGTGDPAS